MKYLMSLFIAAGMAAVVFVSGCGSSSSPVGTSPGTPAPVVTTTPSTPTPDPVTTPVSVPNPVIVADIRSGSGMAVRFALQEWAKSHPDAVAETAKAIAANAENAKQYLNGGKLDVSEVVMTVFNSSLLKNMPPELSLVISGASIILNHYVSPPSATTFMSATEVAYLSAFLDGVIDACNPNPPTSRSGGHQKLLICK